MVDSIFAIYKNASKISSDQIQSFVPLYHKIYPGISVNILLIKANDRPLQVGHLEKGVGETVC